MRKNILIVSLGLLTQFCKAQNKKNADPVPAPPSTSFIWNTIQHLYSTEYYCKLHFTCQANDFSVQWQVDTLGNIINFNSYNKNIPPLLLECVKKAIYSTNGQWLSAYENDKKTVSKIFSLTISYSFQGACKENINPKQYIINSLYSSHGTFTVPVTETGVKGYINLGLLPLIDKELVPCMPK